MIPYRKLLSSIGLRMGLEGDEEVLDLGAGTGNLNYFLEAKCNVTALDNSHAALARLQRKFPACKCVKSSLADPLPFPDGTFDRIVSNNVLYTLPEKDWHFAIAEIKRVLKPGGRVVISNLKQGFSPWRIYVEHLRLHAIKEGLLSTVRHVLKLLLPTVQIFRFNRMIQQQHLTANYTFLRDIDFQRTYFENAGFRSEGPSSVVYSKQAILDSFIIT